MSVWFLLLSMVACYGESGPPPFARKGVIAVHVRPGSLDMPLGSSGLFTAEPVDSAGNVLERSVRWSSSDTNVVAPMGEGGLLLAKAIGAATITATSEGESGSATVTVTPALTKEWANEPAGFTTFSDQPWSLLTALDWFLQFGTATIGLDPTAPLSPPNVLTITYPAGFVAGSAPGTMFREVPRGVRGLYMGMWWKPSAGWEGHASNVNKIQFLFPRSGGDIAMVMYGPPNGPFELKVLPQFPGLPSNWLPNVTVRHIALGVWHKIEWLLVAPPQGSASKVGVSRWWLDGVLVGDRADVPFPITTMDTYKVSPTWGGIGGSKTRTDSFLFDHVYLSIY